MKYLLILLLFCFQSAFSQNVKKQYKEISIVFERYYNEEKWNSIFSLFSKDMQIALPMEQTIDFFTDLKNKSGKIKNREFIKFENSFAVYKTSFERALFALQISLDDESKINALMVKPFTETDAPKIEKNITSLILPFHLEWTVTWGGDTKELNYHIENEAQKNAFDFIITDALGKSYKTNGLTNEDYYAFGKEIIAPCEGEIIMVVDGIHDNVPGEFNPYYIPGNSIVLKTTNIEFLVFAHFKQHSIVVKKGQKVKKGELLGLCGNSGNSSEAHLHFHIQNLEKMNGASGVKCFFKKISVNGKIKENYSPIKNEKIKN